MGSRRQRRMRIVAYFALVATIIGSATAQEFSEAAAEDERTFNGNGNFNNLGGFDFNNLFTNQNIGTWYAVLGALLLVPLILAIPLLAGGGGLGGLFGNRRQYHSDLFSTVWRKTQQTAGLHRLFPQWVSRCCWRTSSPPATSMDPCSRVSLVLAKFEA